MPMSVEFERNCCDSSANRSNVLHRSVPLYTNYSSSNSILANDLGYPLSEKKKYIYYLIIRYTWPCRNSLVFFFAYRSLEISKLWRKCIFKYDCLVRLPGSRSPSFLIIDFVKCLKCEDSVFFLITICLCLNFGTHEKSRTKFRSGALMFVFLILKTD